MTRQAWMRAALALGWAMALAGCPGDEGGGGGVAGAGTVSGRVTYDFVPAIYSVAQRGGTLAFNQAEQRPARNAVVQVREGNTVLATGATDAQGNYSVSFDAKGTGALTVVALAKSVSPEIQVVDNTDGKSIWAIGDSIHTGANTMNLYATHGWTGSGYDPTKRAAAPFAILDTMYTEATAFQAVRPVVFPALKVNWSPDNVPEAGDKATGKIGTSHFAPDENEIYVLGKQGVDTDEFDSHVIAHEWGHYFESNLSRSDSPGGRHQGGDVLDPRLSFGEGYGNAIAAILLPDSMYVDTLWGGAGQLGAIGFDAEAPASPTDDPTPSAFSEMSVLRILYDLFDGGTNEGFDQTNLGLGTFYDVFVGRQKQTPALTTLASFVAGLKAQSGVNAAQVDTLLAHYNVGAINSEFGDGDPALRDMYAVVGALPATASMDFRGAPDGANKFDQNQYYVITGNGSTVTVTANATSDVGLQVFHVGQVLAVADENLTGTETLSFPTQSGQTYVVSLVGFEESATNYTVNLTFSSP